MNISSAGVRGMASRLSGFAALSLLTTVTSFLMLPLIARLASESEWVAIAVGQSVGSLLAICVGLGWNLTGPSVVARLGKRDQSVLYVDSLINRLIGLCLAVPLSVIAVTFLAPQGERTLAIVMSLPMLMAGIGIEWYCVGVGSWLDIARYDLVPRLLASAIAIPILFVSQQVVWYPILLVAFSVVGVTLFSARELAGVPLRSRVGAHAVLSAFRGYRMSFIADVAGGTYSAGSTALVSLCSTVSETAIYSSGDRIYRLALQSVLVLSRTLQGWVLGKEGLIRERARAAIAAHVVLAVGGAVFLGILGPPISGLLFGSSLAFDRAEGWVFGSSFFAIACGTAMTRIILVPSGRVKAVMASTLLGSIFGVPAIAVGAGAWGTAGGAAGLALSQFVVCAAQLPTAIQVWRELSRRQSTVVRS